MSGLLQDKVVVLSGVGPGLGRSLGEVCADQGAHLVLASRTETRLEKAAAAVREKGRRALAVPTDITDPAAGQALVDATLAEFGRADVLINNAFAIPPMEPLTTLAEDALRTSNETNVLAPLRLTRLFADALAASHGSVVMVNSAVIHHSRVEFGGYKLAKGALLHPADYSNTIGQAFVVRAFAALHDGLLDDTTAFLLQQQCAAGWFREGMGGSDHTCDGAAKAQRSPSVDATAHGIRALLAARAAGVKGLTDDIDDAVSWLVRRQRLDGSFVGNGVANANSTGLAAYALASTGHPGPAGTAAAWVRRHQVDGLTIEQHPRLKGYNGSVAYNDADLVDGEKDGVSRGTKRTWQRAAAEGALALPALLPRRTLGFAAPDRAARGSRATVTIRGLKPGERWAVRQAGVVLAQGRVPATGRVVAQVRMPDRRARVTLRAVGSRVSRTATQAVTLR